MNCKLRDVLRDQKCECIKEPEQYRKCTRCVALDYTGEE